MACEVPVGVRKRIRLVYLKKVRQLLCSDEPLGARIGVQTQNEPLEKQAYQKVGHDRMPCGLLNEAGDDGLIIRQE